MLIYSMSVSVDGFIADREGAFGVVGPSEEPFRFHTAEVGKLGGLGRRLYETMLVWRRTRRCAKTSSAPRSPTSGARSRRSSSAARSTAFRATPGSPKGRWPRSAARSRRPRRTSRSAAPAWPAAIELGLVDELRMFRYPVVVGGGTPYLPPVTEDIRLDLIETRTFGSRVIYERYQRVRGVL